MNTLLEKLHLSTPSQTTPAEPGAKELKELRGKYEEAKQDHVFHYYDELDVAGKASLFEQLTKIDPQHVNEIRERALKPAKSEHDEAPKLDPLPKVACASILDSSKEDIDSWYQHGLELVAGNKVGVVLMAGGQGTRLGSSEPKGCYNIGLPSQKSLFQLQAERIVKIQELAKQKHSKESTVIPWYVMTSGPTMTPTQKFFEEHKYFGLHKEDVVFFEQGVLPCLSDEGKILLENKSKVSSESL